MLPVPALRNLCTLLADWSGEYPDPAVAAAKAAVAADELDLQYNGSSQNIIGHLISILNLIINMNKAHQNNGVKVF